MGWRATALISCSSEINPLTTTFMYLPDRKRLFFWGFFLVRWSTDFFLVIVSRCLLMIRKNTNEVILRRDSALTRIIRKRTCNRNLPESGEINNFVRLEIILWKFTGILFGRVVFAESRLLIILVLAEIGKSLCLCSMRKRGRKVVDGSCRLRRI